MYSCVCVFMRVYICVRAYMCVYLRECIQVSTSNYVRGTFNYVHVSIQVDLDRYEYLIVYLLLP